MRLAQDEFANRSQNIVKFRKICYSFANLWRVPFVTLVTPCLDKTSMRILPQVYVSLPAKSILFM